ncbi:MAG TPA: hypothetical protein VEW65_07535 [Chryseolinea sp.]|nr:hypothetical protein [Chryseolinea sp.]
MKRLHIIAILISLTLESSGQGGQLKTKTDTLKLLDFAQKFGHAINSKDVDEIREMSLTSIHCRLCIDNPFPPKTSEYFYVKLDTFLQVTSREPELTKLWTVIKDKNVMINSYNLEKPFRQKELKGLDRIFILEVFFTALKPDEYKNGQERQQTALQFVKFGDDFKFYGIDTVP